ncbi:MAG TPA: MFS transporter [Bryobacteraceae bacterium]|nr:MFS transporter [Bryobacteraceae bacterium]
MPEAGLKRSEAATNTGHGLGYAWYVVIALTAIYMLGFVDRQVLSLLVRPIKQDLHISDTSVGLLQGLAFALFYTLMGLPLGRLVDTRNRRNLISLGIVVWSLFTSACSLARSFGTLFLGRMGVGVGEATLSPAAYSLISDYFPTEKLGVAISVYYMGVYLGSALSFFVTGLAIDALAHTPVIQVPLLGAMASWRITFLLVGVPGLLFALLVYTIREPVRKDLLRAKDGRSSQLSFGQTVAEVRKRWKSVAGTSLGAIFQSACAFGLLAWTPTFFQRVHGWTPGQSGRALAVILVSFGCFGMWSGGALADRWHRRGVLEGPLKVGVVSGIGTAILLPLAMLAPRAGWTLALLVPGIFFMALPTGTGVAALQRIFPNQVRGQVSALFLFFLNLGGQTLGPLGPGFLNDHLFHNEKMIGPSMAITIGVAAILMIFAFLATYRPYQADFRAMHSATASNRA